ncbi:MAG: 30S ribosomal protein S12 methylthiotransferase RimO [Treponema sp.]|jgi:ribosomal protein S12 methylthiotransferase|nr:30S ribosomal protein S12 methylthiotransferase RimO [Treponema sp.]
MKRYYIDPFGCAKNQVDAENMMAHLNLSGWEASDAGEADLIIVNSCGFIESAKRESLDAVFAWRKLYPEKKILLAGCLAERYGKELAETLHEADGFFGIGGLAGINAAASGLFGRKKQSVKSAALTAAMGERPLLSLPGSAYIKISEGCDNRCSYCAIPLIRGGLRSRSIDNILDECRALLDRGIRELCIIAQDIASYSGDFGRSLALEQAGLPSLLEAVSRLKGEFWVRLLYIHPDNFPLPVLDILKSDNRFLPYFDLPFQHGSEKILRLMNRKGNAETYLKLLEKIRSRLPDAVIRTTFMTGFPGEGDDDFDMLLDFQEKAGPDWMGCFAYSREEDTQAYSMKKRVPKKTAAARKKILEERQIAITEKKMDRFVNKEFKVLVEEKIEGEESIWLGRLYCHAPDIDGSAVIRSRRELVPGGFAIGRVFARAGFDLEVEAVQP